jgi:hypothetical protein
MIKNPGIRVIFPDVEGARLQPCHQIKEIKPALAAEGIRSSSTKSSNNLSTFGLCLGTILTSILAIAGCHSRFVEATIDNQGASNLSMIEIDYPSASFGVGNLAPNSQFHYRFKIQGSGPVKLEYTDAQGKTHTVDGPELTEGQEGSLTVAIDSTGKVTWNPNFTKTP